MRGGQVLPPWTLYNAHGWHTLRLHRCESTFQQTVNNRWHIWLIKKHLPFCFLHPVLRHVPTASPQNFEVGADFRCR
jgi:hypothetical protein